MRKSITALALSFALLSALPAAAAAPCKAGYVKQGSTCVKAPAKKPQASSKAASSKPAAAKKAPAPSASCVIKGNISSSKEKIFHVPGCASYGATVIDVAKGERMFCTEAEARAAGWRKALNCP